MVPSRPILLQMSPFSDYLDSGLAARFDVLRWDGLDPAAREAWLREHAASVRAIATAGHVGCEPGLLAALPSLRIVAINGVGVDKVDLALAKSRGVRVSTTPGTLGEDVADLAVGLTIALLRTIPAADAYVRAGHWESRGEWPLARKVTGRRFGILGLGSIGAALAARLAPFGAVAYCGPTRKAVPYQFHADVLSLARASDVLLVTCPANASTRRLVGREVFDALGPAGYVVNVARGAVVDEQALVEALESGRLAGAALDVFEAEPRVPEALRSSPRVVLTPHVASATHETRLRMADLVLANLDAVMAGREPPTAVV
jgi:lactate dehydrogenase-like 2-hydroxyacid dehydrogenase